MSSLVLVDRSPDGVVTLKLNRPDVLNAMTAELGDALLAEIDRLKSDDTVRAVVLTGEGRAFSAGGDLKMIEDNGKRPILDNRVHMKAFYQRYLTIRDIPVPTIAAFNGAAIGAGFCIGLACDLRIAAAGAKLALNFVRLGLHPGMGATWLLPRVGGLQAAADLLYSGRTIGAEEALQMGLVARVVAPEKIHDEAQSMAAEIAQQGPVAVRMVKKALRQSLESSLDQQLEFEALQQAVTLASADFREGVAAARDKRKPVFKGN